MWAGASTPTADSQKPGGVCVRGAQWRGAAPVERCAGRVVVRLLSCAHSGGDNGETLRTLDLYTCCCCGHIGAESRDTEAARNYTCTQWTAKGQERVARCRQTRGRSVAFHLDHCPQAAALSMWDTVLLLSPG
ncbi:unnamed protein product [Pleuronectes platessa]|uniref:Uncharacterized protein n=1 Tax=Pleuronectes platessa TaxID=8262 RepID=A0A9N7Y8S2_PLEPL|nr:unnamed protein product [Pleuronectes platessa]